MRYGVVGDIHSNLQALDAVLDALDGLRVEGYLCLGDLVGYGADPKPVIDRVRGLGPLVMVGGNHDWGVAGRLSLNYFNQQARAAIHWTRSVLDRADVAWLGSLDPYVENGDITLAHGTVHDPDRFDYLQTPYDAYLSFQALKTPTGFVGHSHIPVTFFDGTPVSYSVDERVELGDRRAIVNVGSVGQPRDENPLAAFGVYDTATRVVEIHRVAYDVDQAAQRIVDAGLPTILGDRLHVGR
ncbi:MAG: metallophosphoesterase family protein [Planctomycetota bacterium]|nr:metallophosphoesterase family protein [Planctomycetota bacterium]